LLHAFQHLSVYSSECLLLMLLLLCGKLQKNQEEYNRDISYPIIANYCQKSMLTNRWIHNHMHTHSYAMILDSFEKWNCLLLITFLNTLLPKCIWWYSTIWPTHLHTSLNSLNCQHHVILIYNNETHLLLNIRFFYILINYMIPNSHAHNNELINFNNLIPLLLIPLHIVTKRIYLIVYNHVWYLILVD
jgi:hypothetical protein